MVKPSIDPANFIGEVGKKDNFHVKLLRVIIHTDDKRYWKIETKERKLGIILETDISYAPMVDPVEVEDCFLMTASVQKHAATETGETQTFFRSVEITRNFGTPRKAKT